jgi:hypothetical protein
VLLWYYIKQKQPMNYDKIKESVEFGIKNIKKEHYENYFYNAYDKNKLKTKIDNLSNRLHKKPKITKKQTFIRRAKKLIIRMKTDLQ